MKSLFSFIVIFTITSVALFAQCPEQQPTTLSTVPDNCNQAIVLTPYIQNCQTVCFSSAGSTTSGGVSDLSCFGGSNTNDVWLTAPNPYNTVTGYDGSLVFRWIDWPNKSNGIPNPNISIHAEIAGSAGGGLVTINIDCTNPAPTQSNNFAQENAFCIQNSTTEGNQFYGVAGTIPPVNQIPPPSGVTINNIQYYLQVVPADGGRGNYCFDVSTYKPGFLCGDALPISLTGSGTLTGTASGCLCTTALDGTVFNNNSNNLPVPCGVESPASAWYALTLPFACNKVSLDLSSWGGTGNYNLALLSGVNCPGTTSINPYTGAIINTPGQTLQPGAVIEASSCGQALNICRTLAAGTYYVYISGATERPTYTVNVSVQEVVASVGTVTSPQNNQSVCSGSNVELNSTGAGLPLSGSCGQNVLWYISSNLNFNPYNNQGTLLGSGTGNLNFPLPANNTCAPVTYYIKGVLSDNGTTPQSGCRQTANTITVTIYPEIGQLTLLNQPCIITAAPRCPSFTINGQPGTAQVIGNFALDGQPITFTVSNGLQGCEVSATDTMRCSGNCDQPAATATLYCDPNDIYNYYVDVDFTPGSAYSYTIVSSDGLELLVFSAGTYTMGPFTNGTTVSISVTNSEDANCNVPLGNFTRDCNPVSCPNLTAVTATLSGGGNTACEGATVLLEATVDQGVLNQDYAIQWYVNGNAIAGANTLSYNYTTDVADGCSGELQEYSAAITCLVQNASPSQTPQLTASNSINVFPVPVLGTDFFPSSLNCTTAPVDLCNGLDIAYSPTVNPTPGAGNTTVTYIIKVAGAPAGCEANGSYVVQCPPSGCSSSAGNGVTPADNVVCFGEQFTLSTSGAALDNGYSIGYAWTTTNPYGDLDLAIQTAIANNRYLGPYAANATPQFTNNGATFQQPGTYYFIPFIALNIPANQVAYTQTGSFSVSAPFGGGSASITVPSTVAYCLGVSSFNANLTVQQQSNTGLLNAIDGVTGPIITYSGGATTNLNLNNTNFTGDPNGAVTTISGSGNLFWGSAINYNFTLRYNAVPFPARCGFCADLGDPLVFELLPQISLTVPTAPQICFGESVELTDYNPSANISGTIIWYNGNPSQGGTVIQNTNVIPASGGTTYWALFKSANDSTCSATTTFTVTPDAAPAVNQLTPPAPICAGTVVDLTAYNSAITTAPGTIVWFRGSPQTNPNAVRLPDALAATQQPVNGSQYCAMFTNAGTGCFAYSCVTFTVNPKPALTSPAVDPSSCDGVPFDLNTLEPGLTAAAGTFVWYEGDPDNGGTQLTPLQETGVIVTLNNADFCTYFTDNATTCENKICLQININPLPALNQLSQQGPICSVDVIDLTSLQTQITSDNGNWEWKDENGNVVANPSEVYAQQNTFYAATFTSSLTGCSDTTSVAYAVNPSPGLNTISTQSVCVGDTVNLTSYESQLTADAGTFTWYKGDSVNFGTLLTLIESQQQFPAPFNVYRAVFENTSACKDTQSLEFTINPLPVLNSLNNQKVCFGVPADLTLMNDSATTETGTFVWYPGINTSGTPLTPTEAQSQNITGIVSYTVEFTDVNGCSETETVVYSSFTEVLGGTASYSCALSSLVVNLSGMSGGAGGGYNVAPNSPNQNGQTLANGSSFAVIVQDSLGCQQDTLTGSVSCLVCAVGNATAENDTACCNLALHLEADGITTSPNYTIGWGLSAVADGPITSSAGVTAAAASGYVWQGNADGSLDFTNQCNIPAGTYYFTPFIIEDPVITPLLYDTLNGCKPDGQICPTFSTNLDWKVDTLMGVFPNGDTTDLIRKLTEQLLGVPGGVDFDIDQTTLTDLLGGALPCLQLTNLFAGDPNGTWSFIVNNIGTGPLTFNVPDFEILVDADSCAALNGVDQVVIIPGVSVVIPPNGQYVTISFQIPPLPSSFPSINAACEAYGNAVQVYVTDDANLCTNSISNKNKVLTNVMLMPNPAMNLITISADLIKKEMLTITAIDVFGKEVLNINTSQQLKHFERTIDISAFATGVYLFKIQAGNELKTIRVIKQ